MYGAGQKLNGLRSETTHAQHVTHRAIDTVHLLVKR